MGNIKVRNPLFSKKLKRGKVRLLIIDDNQIRFNQICDQLKDNDLTVVATLLDDVKNFEKQLHTDWDLVIFGRAYDLKVDQAISLIRSSAQPDLPLVLLTPDDYHFSQYTDYVRKGLYDVVNIDYPERFYYSIIRTLSFSRLQQQQHKLLSDLETAQIQAQSLVEDSSKALATIQEGIHIQANAEYLSLFGFKEEDEIIGLPLLDLLQPENINELKTRIKKANQGQFDLGVFSFISLNEKLSSKNPLNIEFLKATEDDMIQIAIDIAVAPTASTSYVKATSHIHQQINLTLQKQPAPINALVTFSLAACPEQILKADWATSKTYFENIRSFLKEQTQVALFKVNTLVHVGLFQADSQEILKSKMTGLAALEKPQLLEVNGATYQLQLRIGYSLLNDQIKDETHFDSLVAKAFDNQVSKPCDNTTESFESAIPLDFQVTDVATIENPTLNMVNPEAKSNGLNNTFSLSPSKNTISRIAQVLENGEIHLKYQQFYDKEDSNLYTYEVTSGYINDSKWQCCNDIAELSQEPELSIKLDRWILVEACKQLHNFITQYPDAKLVVNLNKHILFQDKAFPEFVGKLITIIDSNIENPLILQFAEEDLVQSIEESHKKIAELNQQGALVSVRSFGQSMYSDKLLTTLNLHAISLHPELTNMLATEDNAQTLAEKLNAFAEIHPVNILVRELNDMNLFANAWNVDARFLQGDYFQKKLDHLIDVQDQ